MIPRARIAGLDTLGRRLAAIGEAAADSAVAAAADALTQELERVREPEGLPPLARDGVPRRRRIVARDPASVARELGTLDTPPAPWLAPVLPGARRPMRAAAQAQVRAVARALSRRR
jgi:hypothetical protein